MTNPKLTEPEKQFLLGLTNVASKQFADGLDTTAILNYVSSYQEPVTLSPAAALCKTGLPTLPTGIPIKSLPLITEASGGLMGMWLIGGPAGIGKSSLAWQLCLEAGKHIPVLVYDLELGDQNLIYRTSKICGENIQQVQQALKQVYIRDSIATLEGDLLQIKPPALILVDSIQKCPTALTQRRGRRDKYLNRLETLAKHGYTILLVSELNRQWGNEQSVNSFKESSELGYSCSFGVTLLAREDGSMGVMIVKNRHRQPSGFITALTRDTKKIFWWSEI